MEQKLTGKRLSLTKCLLNSLKLMEEDFINEYFDEIKEIILRPDEINIIDLQYVVDEGNKKFSFAMIMKVRKKNGTEINGKTK